MAEVKFKSYAKEVSAAAKQAADDVLIYAGTKIVEKAQADAPRFTGNLARSLTMTRPYMDGRTRALSVGTAGGKNTKEEVRYAMIREKGRRAGAKRPPTEALMPWVELVLGVGRTWKGKKAGAAYVRKGSRKMKDELARMREIRSVAFIVARSIGRKGSPGKPYLLPAYDEYANRLGEMFQRRLEAHLQKINTRPVSSAF
jgi:hypothetical protein